MDQSSHPSPTRPKSKQQVLQEQFERIFRILRVTWFLSRVIATVQNWLEATDE